MIRVLIADDHAVVREGLKKILSRNEDISVAAEACDGAEMLEKARAKGWDVAILDISLPGRSGLEVLHDLRKNDIRKPILILTKDFFQAFPDHGMLVNNQNSDHLAYRLCFT